MILRLLPAMLLLGCPGPAEDPSVDEAGRIEGLLIGPEGEPLAGVYVTTDPSGREARAGTDGHFAIDRVRPGTYRLVLAGEGLATRSVHDVEVRAGEQTWVEAVVHPELPQQGVLRVSVEDPRGLPLHGAVLRVIEGPESTTDAEGFAWIAELGGQVVDVEIVDAEGMLWGRRFHDLHVPEHGAVDLAVRLSGRPFPGAREVGSLVCSGCHPEQGAKHAASAHASAAGAGVWPAFATWFAEGGTVALEGGSVTLQAPGGTPTVVVEDAEGEARSFPVTEVLGSPQRGAVPLVLLGDQSFPLPVAWAAERPGSLGFPEESERLVPFEPERWLIDGAFTFAAGQRPDPALSAEATCLGCHLTGIHATPRTDGGVDLVASSGAVARQVEHGVGCESCHGPGSSHVVAPAAEAALRITRPDLLDTPRANEVCAQCHATTEAHGTGLPYPHADSGPFQAGAVLADHAASTPHLWPSGAAAVPGAQADELLLSAHGPGGAYEMRCYDCHDPHGAVAGPDGPLPHALRLDARDNSLCLSCHLGPTFEHDLASVAAHVAHATYDPAGETRGGRCVECHMPRTSARLAHGAGSGAGDLSSHVFDALAPADTMQVFEEADAAVLPLGHFPVHACSNCHEANAWRVDQAGLPLFWPVGDPTRKLTHEIFQASYEVKYP